ncbi:MAG: riboflavin biosynthesis protein RibF [Gemmatimonadetes bacterium]|nr:riboflavin biosynthesis protein RibF [Gemmatimonadota bacterium]MBI2402230.1 riboflavin biosynthesis protein RibF [Gemmatimonadota bacterium]MBI2616370.1 riboflavin biosynthesis protein RibF [Gemmatimonadota bacterium]
MTGLLPDDGPGSVITVGTFDGVHLGHHRVLEEIAERARRSGRRSLLVTFEPHPLEIVNPPAAPPLLTLAHERREVLAQSELDAVVFMPFTRELSHLSAEQFVRLLMRRYHLRELVIGFDHGMGRGRTGDVNLLRDLGRRLDFSVDVVEAVAVDGRSVSSTLIRRAVAGGDLAHAARFLGRPYSLTAPVVAGAGRGRTIGYRTINLELPDHRKLLPPDGVYAVRVEWLRGTSGGMMHQGPRPTFGDARRSLEVHLFDPVPDLYGQLVKLCWVARLRDVRTFPTADALKQQLDNDFAAAHAALTGSAGPASH